MIELLTTVTLYCNSHYLSRYIKFVTFKLLRAEKPAPSHLHHILPKAADMFPEFKDLKLFRWNGIALTPREHFIAHRMLHKAFPGSSQSIAFFNMANICGKTNSRAYQEAMHHQLIAIKLMTQSPERNAKISAKLKGKPKSPEHRLSMLGHIVTDETREKLRKYNTGKKASQISKDKMSATRSGRKYGSHTAEGKKNISTGKKLQNRKWYNNGTISCQYTAPPDNTWCPGRLESPTKGMKWFTDGVTSMMALVPPTPSWQPGRIIKKK